METILMSKSERKRLAVMAQMTSGKLDLSGASELLGLSYRQTNRVLSQYRAEGDRGLVHGLRGKHDWFEGRRAWAVLMVIIDDASGRIMARSPQAKGRVERMNRTLQDRLVKALRQAQIISCMTQWTSVSRAKNCIAVLGRITWGYDAEVFC